MFKKIIVVSLAFITIGCHYTESATFNEDGSGHLSLKIDMSKFMKMMPAQDSSQTDRKDTTVSIKKLLEERKDSLAKLSPKEQEKLQRFKDFSMRAVEDRESREFWVDIFGSFKDIRAINNMAGELTQMNDALVPGRPGTDEETTPDAPFDHWGGVSYHFEDGVFERDAYIKDEQLYRQMLDSLQIEEGNPNPIASYSTFTLEYTFPREIAEVSAPGAEISADGKTITVERNGWDYLANPDTMDLRIELEQ